MPAALDVFAADPQIHSLMVIVGSLASRAREITDVIRALHDRMDKPVCVVWPSPPSGVIAELARYGIPAFLEPARGMRALGRLVEYHALASRPSRPAERAVPSFDWRRLVPERGPNAVIAEIAVMPFPRPPVAGGRGGSPERRRSGIAARRARISVVLKAISARSHTRPPAWWPRPVPTQEVAHTFAVLTDRAAHSGGADGYLRATDDQGDRICWPLLSAIRCSDR